MVFPVRDRAQEKPAESENEAPASEPPETRESFARALLAEFALAQEQERRPMERVEVPRGTLPTAVTPFTQRFGYEESLYETVRGFNQGWLQWGYLSEIDPVREIWADAAVNLYMSDIDGVAMDLKDPVGTSIITKWREIEHTVPDDEYKVLFKRAFASRWATDLGLTLRRKERSFKALDHAGMRELFGKLDPAPRIEQPEEIGVLQLGAIFAHRIKKQKDTFFMVDMWKYAPEQFGGGKSQLLLQILAATARFAGYKFDFRRDVVYADDHARLRRFLGDREVNACRGVDELDQFAYKRRSQHGEQKATIDVWKRNRKWGQLWGASGPSLWELDEFLRDIKVTHRIRIRTWDDEARIGTAEVFAKGGDKDEMTDTWGHFNMSFEYRAMPSVLYDAYKACVRYVEDYQRSPDHSALDKHLADKPEWLADLVNRDMSTLGTPEVPTSSESVKTEPGVGTDQ